MSAQNRLLTVLGANHTITASDLDFLPDQIKNYDILMLQQEIPMQINEYAAHIAAAAGIPIMMNCAPYAPMKPEFLQKLSYISPNEHEAQEMTGIRIQSFQDAHIAAKSIQDAGVKNVLITMGGRGAVLLTENGEFIHQEVAANIRVMDPTAAGDSFVSAFCTGICAGLSNRQALKLASYTAGITVSRMGAQPSLPTLQEVREHMAAQHAPGENLPIFDIL